MLETAVPGSFNLLFLMPGGIIIPADHIQVIGEFAIVEALVVIHEIRSDWL